MDPFGRTLYAVCPFKLILALIYICIPEHRTEHHTERTVWGGSNIRKFGYEINVTDFFAHPNFDYITGLGDSDDIAVGRLAIPMIRETMGETDDYILNTVCLPHWNTARYVPSNATIFGFGHINDPHCPPAHRTPVLLKGIVPIREHKKYLISGQNHGNDSRPCYVSSLFFRLISQYLFQGGLRWTRCHIRPSRQ